MNIFKKFFEIFDAMNDECVEYVLVGGFAVILYGLPRLTQDIDLFLKPEKKNIDALKKVLKKIFNDDSIDEITIEMLEEFPVVRYGSPEGITIDLIIRLGDAFSYSDISYDTKNIQGHIIRIATPAALFDMKKNTVRPVDKSDSLFLADFIKQKADNAGI